MSYPSPIIVIGAARSGTKFLRDILASGEGTAVVPYDVNYVWRYGVESDLDDGLKPNALTEKRVNFIRSSLTRLANARREDILIEKTVANTLRIPFVEAVFPTARYVHIIRDGRDVVESAMRQWQSPPSWQNLSKKFREMPIRNLNYAVWFAANLLKGRAFGRKGGNVWGPRFAGIDEIVQNGPLAFVCAMQWHQCVTTAVKDLSELKNADNRVFQIKYESLISDSAVLSDLVEKLELPSQHKILTSFHRKLQPTEPKIWQELPKNDIAIMNQLLAPTLRNLGYTI